VHVSSEAAWVGPLDIELLPPTPIFSKVGGETASRRHARAGVAAAVAPTTLRCVC